MNKTATIFLIVCLNWIVSFTQSYPISTDNIYTGYTKGIAKDLLVDKWGFIWMASDEGVFRFDGKKSLFFKDEIKGGYAKSFFKAQNDHILLVHDFGLTAIDSRPDTSVFTLMLTGSAEFSDTSLHYPKSIFEDKSANIWIGEPASIVRYASGTFQKFNFEDKDRSFDFYRSFSFTEDESGTLWSMSFHGSLFYFDQSRNAFEEMPLDIEIEGVSNLTYMGDGIFRASAKNGVFELAVNLEENTVKSRRIPGVENISSSAWIDNKDFYVGTWDDGLYHLVQKNGRESWEKVKGLPFDDIIEIVFDEKNGIWIAGSQDFALLKPAVFDLYLLSDETLPVETIHFWNDQRLMVAIEHDIFTLNKSEDGWQVVDSINLFDRVVTALCRDQNSLWIGDVGGEVYKYNFQSNELQRIDAIRRSTTRIKEILKDASGNIWILGNEMMGLCRITPDGNITFYTDDGINKSKSILELPNGEIFVCGGNADSYLFKYNFRNREFEDISLPLPFSASINFSVDDVCEGDQGDLFLASSDGLLSYPLNLTAGKKAHSET